MNHCPILTNLRSKVLLFASNRLHLCIRKVRVRTRARTAGTIGTGDSGKPLGIVLVTLKNPVEGHEFEVVLVRPDPEVSDARESARLGETIWNEEFSGGIVETHFNYGLKFRRTGCLETAWAV
jgi:hypothetical protein